MRTFAPATISQLALRFWPVLACGWLVASPACAQFNATTVNAPTSAFLPARRELKQVLGSAAKAIADERYAEAAGTLGDLLKDPDFEDYFTDAKGQASLKGEAQELVRSLPKLGRESYELQYGADARKLLNTALDEGDEAKLADVVRLYFHTKAGYDAAFLLARQQLDAGQPLLAAMLFQRLLDNSPYASQYDPELSLLTALSWRMAQRSDDAKGVLVAWQKRQPKAVLQLGEQKVPMFAASDDALAWLDKHLGQQVPLTSPLATQWTMHRGDSARNAHTTGSLPLAMFRWHKYLGRDESDDERLLRSAKRYQSEGVAAIPTVSPLVINNQVLMRTPDLLMAVDLQTGKFVWRYPRHDDPHKPPVNTGINRGPSAAERREKELEQRVWRDSAYGQLACDNESVYLLEDLGFSTSTNVPSVLMLPGGARQRNPGQPSNVNTLVALSHTKQGKLRWIVGGETGESEPKLAGAFFLGVPLVHEGRLYAMVEINGELRLTVLNTATGNLLWSQQIAHVDTMTITVDYQRRLAGATPSLADGVLVCPTSASSVVAIDIIERKLLWGYRYTPSPNRPSVNWYGQIQQPKDVGTHWLDAGPIIAQGRVLLTPTESDELICLDLLTGKPAWKPRSRDDDLSNMLYVAGIEQDQILLVGRSRITALKLADGTPAWNAPIQLAGEYPSGRGYFSAGYYYLPTTQSQLLKIDT
ncbi:MAG TPA: PQQ-binding-like beta-propeller repeat protein, partial [Pirellulaceae bacterium]|nr:PQQ-binding-like beta-propeller repeat protein [Pirellulaceae bacterium]